ncbi:hypothetical protein NP493_712g01011 [Ridgeia piscesae]|uniref:Protein FAM122A n=1 Tax=Ridgeia piscesae TaxID=27915 RepID=A0AAD9KS49_RIDPI|nr:hypothetical protein NP493_712g01011 [Ridgeia piscesae]
MEVDPPPMCTSASAAEICSTSTPSLLNPLKRSNSAPMINILTTSTTTSSGTNGENESVESNTQMRAMDFTCSNFNQAGHIERIRRYSTSSACLHSPTTPVKVPSRLNQIKLEECVNQGEREVAHEREVQSTLSISHGWDELTLDDAMLTDVKRPRSFGEPLHIFTSPYPISSSPSPTRVGKQCFSPSLQQPVRSVTMMTQGSTPSPTRKTIRRSMSPIITLRPSSLSVKRKMDVDNTDRWDQYYSPPKRANTSCSPTGSSTPDRSLSYTHALTHSNYSSGLEDESLEQTVPSVTLHSSCLSDTSSSSGVSNMCVMPPTHILFRPVAAAGRHAHVKVTETDMSHSGQSGTDDAMCSEAATYEQFTMSVHRTESLSSSTSTTSSSEQHSAFNKVGIHRL